MEEVNDIKPDNQEGIRDEHGRFVPGVSGNPAGRPKGKTLKEFARDWLLLQSDEEKLEFLKRLDPSFVWRMAEGNPKQDVDLPQGSILPFIINIQKYEPPELREGENS